MRSHYLRSLSAVVLALFVSLSVLTLPASAEPQLASSTDLIEHAAAYDGQEIIFTGEAIGDLMIRDSYAWVNVSDGANAVGLWMTAEQAKEITVLGSYKNSGDKVVVTGVFHRACAEHGGDLDIHVSDMSIVESGLPTLHPVATMRVVLAILLTVLTAALFMVDRRNGRQARDRQRKAE